MTCSKSIIHIAFNHNWVAIGLFAPLITKNYRELICETRLGF